MIIAHNLKHTLLFAFYLFVIYSLHICVKLIKKKAALKQLYNERHVSFRSLTVQVNGKCTFSAIQNRFAISSNNCQNKQKNVAWLLSDFELYKKKRALCVFEVRTHIRVSPLYSRFASEFESRPLNLSDFQIPRLCFVRFEAHPNSLSVTLLGVIKFRANTFGPPTVSC